MTGNLKNAGRRPLTEGVAKVPVIMQMEALECGAACLAMVLAYYNKWLPLEQVRFDCGVSRDGSRAGNIVRAADRYGMTAKGYRFEPEDLKKHATFPCILHWNFNHFVVLKGFRGRKAFLNDPARGSYSVSMDELDQAFTGVCILLEPGETFQQEGQPKSIFSFARKRLKGTGAVVMFVMLTMGISSLMGVITPAFNRVFMDRLLTGENPDWVKPFLFFFTLFVVIRVVIAWIEGIYTLRINGKLAVTGSTAYMWKILRLPMDFFFQRMAGDIQQRKASNTVIAQQLVDVAAPLLVNTVMMLFYLAVMVRYSTLLALIGLLSIVINLGIPLAMSGKRVNITRVQMRDAGRLSATTVTGIEMIETIKSSGSENGFFEKWAGLQASVNTQKVRYTRLGQMMEMSQALVTVLTNTAVLALGVWFTMQGQFTVGMILAFQGILESFTSPAMTMVTAGQTLQEMRTLMERVEDVMEYPEDILPRSEASEEQEYGKLSGRVDMNHVTFGYSRLEEPVIRDFSLHLEPGRSVAFVGTSGCGKSTLTKLLSGLHRPWSGEILFDGKPIEKIDRSVFTGSVAVVDQEIILFEDTIANNIKMWDKTIEDFEMILAARDAQLHEDIMQKEGGYRYRLFENGRNLSGGQRQRLEIARVLAQDPTIIIMDEATSSLDARTEYDVVKSIRDRGITCIIVAHRLSTVRDCDEIIVLDKGMIAERGTHEELYAAGGIYTKLISND